MDYAQTGSGPVLAAVAIIVRNADNADGTPSALDV
jgi:hypothetical protein